jgi:hypothetical protein
MEGNFFMQKALWSLMLLMSCQSCYKEYYPDSRIQEPVDIVLSVLAPDSSSRFVRGNPVEVFVGRLVPTDINNIYYVDGMQDSVLKQLMINTRQFYVAYYEYRTDATVTIEGGGQSVELTYIDRGIYRDVDNELKIKSQVKYKLTVQTPEGRLFTSETRVLEPVTIYLNDDDTLEVEPEPPFWFYTAYFSFTPVNRARYYVTNERTNNFSYEINGYSFDTVSYDGVVFQGGDAIPDRLDYITTRYRVQAFDSSYALFNQPSGHTMTREFGNWDVTLYDISLDKRSNITGENVVGVFASYSADQTQVVYKAKWPAGKPRQRK